MHEVGDPLCGHSLVLPFEGERLANSQPKKPVRELKANHR
jgi:hypothetical protein